MALCLVGVMQGLAQRCHSILADLCKCQDAQCLSKAPKRLQAVA